MKRVRVVIGLGVLVASVGVSVATAAAAAKSAAWTESKAELVVERDATVLLAPFERAFLENELREAVGLYKALELAAIDGGDSQAAAIFHNLAYRYSSALRKVRSGLAVDEAECNGWGPVARGGRFTRFRCQATSEKLEIPSAGVVFSEDGSLPEVLEGEPRIVDAFQARLAVRVTGKATISYRQLGVQAFVPE